MKVQLETCTECHGDGYQYGCLKCDGNPNGCPDCLDTSSPCPACKGSGQEQPWSPHNA